jgi:hypothetical protein
MSLLVKPLQTNITPIEKPTLKVSSSVVPQDFLNKFGKTFDSNLYPNMEIFKD